MRKISILSIFLLLACSSKNAIEIKQNPSDKDIIVDYYWKSEDSLEVFIPYSFKIENKALQETRHSSFMYQPNGKFPENDMLIIDDDDSVKKVYLQKRNLFLQKVLKSSYFT